MRMKAVSRHLSGDNGLMVFPDIAGLTGMNFIRTRAYDGGRLTACQVGSLPVAGSSPVGWVRLTAAIARAPLTSCVPLADA